MSSTTDVSSSSRSPKSKSNADRSRPGSSSASRSKSQSLSLLLLSTSRRAFTCSGVRSSTQTQGTSSMPSFFAAIARQWPITITPSRSITIGCTKPYCLMLSATLLICRLSCFFALDAYGIISAIGLLWITISLSFLTQRPSPTGLCHWHVCTRLSPHLYSRLPWDTLQRGAGSPVLCKQTIWDASLTAVCQRIACCFYTIGRVPPCRHTILHSGFVLRQPPPHHIHASDFSQARWYPGQPRTFQPCAGTSVASVSSFIAGASQIIIIRPAAFVQRTGKTTSAGLRSVRLRGKRSRLWCRRLDLNQRHTSRRGALPTELRLHIAPSGRSRSPAQTGRKEGKRNESARAGCPCTPSIPICISPAHPSNEKFFYIFHFPS